MGFEALLGNDRLKQNLTGSIRRGHISHFYLISGPAGSGKRTLARLLAAAILCRGQQRPCLTCPACRKVLGGGHPDFITVDDPEKKTVPVDLIRKARADMYIQPNESDYKIYLLPRGQDMLEPSQNALLKVLEEPPAYGVFLLLTDNPEKLLTTVRSRCTELTMTALEPQLLRRALQERCPDTPEERLDGAIARSGGYLGQALALVEQSEDSAQLLRFAQCYAQHDAPGLARLLAGMEKLKRDALIRELELWLQLLHNALACRSGIAPLWPQAQQISTLRSGPELLSHIRVLEQALVYARHNGSTGAICGNLVWQLR